MEKQIHLTAPAPSAECSDQATLTSVDTDCEDTKADTVALSHAGNADMPVRKIIHIDMDAFFASVEQRDNPSLKGKPVVVGGLPDQRGVVATASYEARKFGIHSAMPSRTAQMRCPQAIFLRPRFDAYKAVSDQIREIFERYTDLVEPLSLDEAYLDVTSNKFANPSATLIAREIKSTITTETGLTASAGVSINKFLAKTASGINKPDGLCLIAPRDAQKFVESLAIEKFYGIGAVTAEKMRSLGIRSGADLHGWSEADLIKRFGKAGTYYYNIARARDDRPVEPNRIRKSVGAEESFTEDLRDSEQMLKALQEIADTVANRLSRSGSTGRTITLKVKYGDYQQVTRSRTMLHCINNAADILALATELMAGTEVSSRSVRLLGITMSNLEGEEPTVHEALQLTLKI